MIKHSILIFNMVSILIAQQWAGLPGGFLRMGMTSRSAAMGGGFSGDLDHGFAVFAVALGNGHCHSAATTYQYKSHDRDKQ